MSLGDEKERGPRREKCGEILIPPFEEGGEDNQPVGEISRVWQKVKELISTLLSFSLL